MFKNKILKKNPDSGVRRAILLFAVMPKSPFLSIRSPGPSNAVFFDRTSKCLSTKYAAFFEKPGSHAGGLPAEYKFLSQQNTPLFLKSGSASAQGCGGTKGGRGRQYTEADVSAFFHGKKSFSPPPGSHHPFSEAARSQSSSLFSRSGFSGGSIGGVSMARRSSMNSSASERPFCKKKSISFSLNCSISSCNFSAGFIQSA